MKIYFAGSIRGGREKVQNFQQIIIYLESLGHTVLTEHVGSLQINEDGQVDLSDEEIYQQDTQWLKEADLVIADTSTPSIGVGYEISQAEKINKDILVVHNNSLSKLSAMIAGSPYESLEIFYYDQIGDLFIYLEEYLEKFND